MFFRIITFLILVSSLNCFSQIDSDSQIFKKNLEVEKSTLEIEIEKYKKNIQLIIIKIDSINEVIQLEDLKKQSVITVIKKDSDLLLLPSKYTNKLRRLTKNQKIYVVEYYEYGTYYKVIANNKIGYIHKKYLIINRAIKKLKKNAGNNLFPNNSYKPSSKYKRSSGGRVHVKGYYRKDGTYVRPHTRSRPRSKSY